MSVALQLVIAPSSANLINEDLQRRYASERSMTPEGCAWLAAQSAASGSQVRLTFVTGPGNATTHKKWYLKDGDEDGADVRLDFPDGRMDHYEGSIGAERVIRSSFADGSEHSSTFARVQSGPCKSTFRTAGSSTLRA